MVGNDMEKEKTRNLLGVAQRSGVEDEETADGNRPMSDC
jgi:hypothetical protein